MKNPTSRERKDRVRKHIETEVTELLLMRHPDTVILHDCPKCGWRYQLPNQKLDAVYTITDLIVGYVEKNEMLWHSVWEEVAKRMDKIDD